MSFQRTISKVEELLKGPLPGMQGQLMMAPQPLDLKRFSLGVPTHARRGAVLFLLFPDSNECIIPFIKRPTYTGVHSAQVSFPGGKWEANDGDLSVTAIRETEEELGIKSTDIRVLGRLSDLYIPPSNFLVTPYMGFLERKPDLNPDPFEVERVIQCPMNNLLNPLIRKSKQIIVRKETLETPYFEIDQEVVWGATAMILSEFIYLWENSYKQ
jgi:8-oxo-dGTP pyrophosphatase MutT (NUDIX family)